MQMSDLKLDRGDVSSSRLRNNAFAPYTSDGSADESSSQRYRSASPSSTSIYRTAGPSGSPKSQLAWKIAGGLGALGLLLILAGRLGVSHKGVSSYYTTSPTARYHKARESIDDILDRCDHADIHDIKCKVDYAEKLASELVARQSRTLDQAVIEYERRYNRKSSPSMEKWFQLALENNVTIIDDYDQVNTDIQFYVQSGLVGEKLKARLLEAKIVVADPGQGQLSIVDGQAVIFGPDRGSLSATSVIELLKPVQHIIPDFTIPFNWYSEPKMPHPTARSESDPMNLEWIGGKDPTEALQRACPSNHIAPARSWDALLSPLDYCEDSRTGIARRHGFFQAPDGFGPLNKLVPVLSRAKLSNFADIIAPNVCYSVPDYRGSADPVSWEDKEDSLYWRGAFTGLAPTPENWAGGHRHRMGRYTKQLREAYAKLTHGVERDAFDTKFAPNRTIVPTRDSVHVGNNTLPLFDYNDHELVETIKRLGPNTFNVGFYTYRPAAVEVQKVYSKYFPVTGYEVRDTINHYKYLLDSDGQSMSCRFYHLLSTNAVVFKQTIWSESHDERIVPWIHYVPLDLRIESNELPYMLDFFQNHPQGPETARKIAAASARWAQNTLRRIDVSLAFARVLIEYADQLYHAQS
uniref:Glycosyl transferase CAP10 domain-containing protein n=2 Tax=Kalmanozyma brasiliensis (strain GHG001) TaxID=1365824 RepID=V5ECG4_KALBG